MNPAALALLLAGASASGLAWQGAVRRRVTLVFLSRPLVMIALIGAALSVDAFSGVARGLIVAAFGASLVADVVLATPDARLRPAVVAFIVSRTLLAAAVLEWPTFDLSGAITAAMAVVAVGLATGPRLLAEATREGSSAVVAAVVWAGVCALLLIVATATLDPVVIVAAALISVVDVSFGWTCLVGPVRLGRESLFVLAHIGHAVMLWWLMG